LDPWTQGSAAQRKIYDEERNENLQIVFMIRLHPATKFASAE
jgi:hypothetical protein